MQTLSFDLVLFAGPAYVTIETNGDAHTVTSCRFSNGVEVKTRPSDLDLIEAAVEAVVAAGTTGCRVYALQAEDVMTRETVWFTVEHREGHPSVVRYADGYTVPYSSPQWTETTEAFYFDLDVQQQLCDYAQEQRARHDRFARY